MEKAVDKEQKRREKREFAEAFGVLFERMGYPRMAGRLWGWLLVCDPPHQSAAELVEAVSASGGSISTMTRLLTQFGLIERIGLPGRRSGFYRIKSGGFTELLRARMRFTTQLRHLVERGLDLLKGERPGVAAPLREYRDFYAFFEQEFPALIANWEKQREKVKR